MYETSEYKIRSDLIDLRGFIHFLQRQGQTNTGSKSSYSVFKYQHEQKLVGTRPLGYIRQLCNKIKKKEKCRQDCSCGEAFFILCHSFTPLLTYNTTTVQNRATSALRYLPITVLCRSLLCLQCFYFSSTFNDCDWQRLLLHTDVGYHL